jgi:TonB family protein
MGRRNSTLTFSLCASILVHALALYLMAWWYIRHPPPIRFAAFAVPKQLAPIIIRTPPPPPPAPPPTDFSQANRAPIRDDSGEANGKGTANRSTPGDHPMEARQGLEQANLTRSSKTEDTDSKLDEMAIPLKTGALAANDAATPQPSVPEFGVGQPAMPAPSPPTPARPEPSGAPLEVKGHSSRASDTDSFALVAKSNNVHFRDGKMEARQGRKVKTTRPNYGLAAMTDAQSMLTTTVVLGVTVKGDGYVKDVTILQSSGSENIDLPTKEAVYNWWFEPKQDKDGRGLPDLWVVRID